MLKFIYKAIKGCEKKFFFVLRYLRLLGIGDGIRFCLRSRKRGHLVPIQTKALKAPLHLRARTSDVPAFEDVYVFGHCDFSFRGDPKFIVDAGAHIGLVSIDFANKYPDAEIIAIEPEPGNFALLCENAKPYPNIKPLQRALWHEHTTLNIANPDDSTWCYRVEAAADGNVETITVEEIMERFDRDSIDVLKIDIEGSEKEVLGESGGWIDKVGALIIELHDNLKPGCCRTFYNATNGFEFETQVGENVIVSTPQFEVIPGTAH